MKNSLFFLAIFLLSVSYSQNNGKSKNSNHSLFTNIFKKKDTLTEIGNTALLQAQINTLNQDLEKQKSENQTLIDKNKILSDSLIITREVLQGLNRIWLRDMFAKKYMENSDYFLTKDLVVEDDRYKNINSEYLAKSLMIETTSKDTLKICNQVLNFNKAYITLFEIREKVLYQKYDALEVSKALEEIKKISGLDPSGKLWKTKQNIYDLLSNYQDNVNSLKFELEKRKQNPEPKSRYNLDEYEKLKNYYKSYPYLVKIISEMKNDVNSYTKDDLN